MDVRRNKIQLYCNQVFVTSEIENIVPEYLTLLHGVIDSPDIPLNVSRSYLQSDMNVKKISSHITKKVADKLQEIFKNEREDFEKKWNDIKLFIQFGMLTDEKFYERAEKFALLENLDHKYFTLDEYCDKIREAQTDKEGNLICLYTQDPDATYSYIDRARQKGYDVLLMNGELDVHIISQAEQKKEKLRFVRVDSDVIENIIRKEDKNKTELDENRQNALRYAFESRLAQNDKTHYYVSVENVSADALPVFLTQNEFMRRMKDMSAHQQGMSFYGTMPDQYNLVINTAHPLLANLLEDIVSATRDTVAPLQEQLAALEAEEQKLRDEQKDKKNDELTQEEKDAVSNVTKQTADKRAEIKKVYADFAAGSDRISQLIDVALLASGKLTGEALSKFVDRTVRMM